MSAPAFDMARPWAIPSPAGEQQGQRAGRRPATAAAAGAARTAADRRLRVAPAAGPDRTVSAVRLTRRGRAVLVAAFLVVALLGSWPTILRQATPAGPAVTAVPVPPSQAPGAVLARGGLARPYTVSPGDSLWSIATTQRLEADPRRAVEQIAALSGLPDADLVPGQQLWLPVPAKQIAAQGSGG